jgi:phosphoglucomutase
VFEKSPHYTENFIQATLDSFPGGVQGAALVVGGDGRYFSVPAIQRIIRVCAGNGVARLIVGQHGILSTPAVSHLIRLHKTKGGILLTASHNPGGAWCVARRRTPLLTLLLQAPTPTLASRPTSRRASRPARM